MFSNELLKCVDIVISNFKFVSVVQTSYLFLLINFIIVKVQIISVLLKKKHFISRRLSHMLCAGYALIMLSILWLT